MIDVSGQAAEWVVEAPEETAMTDLGAGLAAVCCPGLVIYLEGELGMGKTTFSRGLIRAMGHEGAVKSPTYTLVEPYALAGVEVYHFDLYRLGDPEELEFMGVRDYFRPDSICLIEWPVRGRGILPPADIGITIAPAGSGRRLHIQASTELGGSVLARWRQKHRSQQRQ
ncbi:tRNA (adenosine(37)-N6)-threonylcarbamoyltransferase complex ATPase subunit type 1 TsaE [Parahaliea sp. F7430]|uniref:tRNA threonylcarbamoyladenosine biosynthesis protein TsaE n=1 Tax=Sediminihaliea albiluteola TaxID=2758564 RepID=A0A7W2TTF8_9GAMM|nr:tRNA (adenosine(37)-N6)-threonylcarbamoyltransferase complex ATPase subunit type 1 TsaE [Sediminihaliea albiluteola]MBA6411626.1 tRNA (adenosine(37)-N6)-threonylcarbamoyltransferase complex ATPase subunit type 1 TsaE [Sediminihaliea albiluteola]